MGGSIRKQRYSSNAASAPVAKPQPEERAPAPRDIVFKGSFAEFLQMLRTDKRFYAQTPEEVELVARALIKKNKIKTDVDLATIRDGFSSKLVGYSNADIEAVLLLANEVRGKTLRLLQGVSDEEARWA